MFWPGSPFIYMPLSSLPLSIVYNFSNLVNVLVKRCTLEGASLYTINVHLKEVVKKAKEGKVGYGKKKETSKGF